MTPHTRVFSACALALWLSACGGGSDGSNGLSARMLVSNEAAGAQCANGGTRIDAGLDINSKGLLDATEISSTQYVCNGAAGASGSSGATGSTGSTGATGSAGASGSNGLNTLVSMSAEAAGAHCSNGGQKVEAGLDSNANGVLDASEISSTACVCNGATGAM